ncbi:conserved hypothetical protein [uncultured Mycobacterium sp.]|uniref:DUF4097 domain-containing protein n=1 Tax=uncultured Mycobacterium sp. TaxID=171292 RepID=A0A1Y5P8N8_9MYCO|nr:conserved hypothetical protein [uncultured Mycobacterium sp.]
MTTIAPAPPATATPPPPLTPGGRRGLRVMFVVVAILLVSATVIALGVASFRLSRFRVVADELTLPGDIRDLVIDTADVPAAIRLVTDRDATEPRVSMRLLNSSRSGDQTLAVDRGANRATVTVRDDAFGFTPWSRTGEITVTLPPVLARNMAVTVHQETGVLLAQADLDELITHGTDGLVVLSGSARRVEVHNEDGDIVTREPISVAESFTAETVDGDVTVDFKDAAPRTIEASTRDGDVTLELPGAGPYLVRADGPGNTTVTVPRTSDPERAVAEVTVRTDDGTVAVTALVDDRNRRHR